MVNWSNVRQNASRLLFGPKTINGKPVTNLVSPLGPKVVTGAGSIISTIFKGAKNLVSTRALAPAMGTARPIINTFKRALTGAGVGLTSYGAYQTVKSVQESNLPGFVKAGVTGAGVATSPVGSTLGFITGTGISTGTDIKERVQKIFGLGKSKIEDATNIWKATPDVNLPSVNINYPEFPRGTVSDLIPSLPQNIYLETPQAPSLGYSINPSFSLGGMGGIGENLPLLMALLLGGGVAGGYALGKRKKKKYKKKKNRR